MKSADERATSGEIVAENSSVCRSRGSTLRMRRSGGRKPMSSMRSASSSVRIWTRRQIDRALLHVIEQPAGRGDDDVGAARSSSFICGRIETPPKMAVTRRFAGTP